MNNVMTDQLVESMMGKFLEKSKNIIFYKTDDGDYVLFDKYTIKKTMNGIIVVIRHSDHSVYEFLKLKHATTWCILDRYNRIVPANRVLELDKKISSSIIDRKIHMKAPKEGVKEKREIYRDKMLFDENKLTSFQWELDKYITMAKDCQRKGFENELKRIHSK